MRAEQERRLEALEAVRRGADERQQMLSRIDVKAHEAEIYHGLHDDIERGGHTFYNLPGGRGSGKSSFAALETVNGIMKDQTGMSNALIVRKWAVALRGSVFNQIQWALDVLGVADRWRSTLQPMQFIYETGQVIRFTGLDDPQKLKSIRPSQGYFKYLWIEEFSEIVGEPELRNLQQSVMRGGSSFVVLRSFNPPISAASWVNRLVDRPDDKSVTLRTTYLDVPAEWLGQPFLDEAERLKEINPRAFEHEFMGRAVGSGSEVFENLEVREVADDEFNALGYCNGGIDWGFSVDPVVYLRVAYDHRTETIVIMDEIYKRGLGNAELVDEIRERGLDHWRGCGGYVSPFGGYSSGAARLTIFADSAEPKSIADVNGLGLKVRPCHKEPGCVMYRLKWLQHRRIVIDPARTPNAAREFQEYSYNVDRRTGEILSSVPDLNNHTIDALAYALDREIYGRDNPV